MRAGQVVRIRVNPKDCVSVLDVMKAGGIDISKMSYSSIVSLALSAMLQGLRDGGTIPDRDGFEYAEMMEPYLRNGQGGKIKIANQLYRRAADGSVTAGIGQVNPVQDFAEAVETHFTHQRQPNEAAAQQGPLSEEERYARQRLTELVHKKDLVEDGAPGVSWSNGDQEEYDKYYKVVYPDG